MIDGFPIDEEQAESFVTEIGEPTLVLAFEANDEILKDRLKSRNNFDDTEESIKKRVENFGRKTRPVMAKYKAKIVNAERTPEAIFGDVEKLISS